MNYVLTARLDNLIGNNNKGDNTNDFEWEDLREPPDHTQISRCPQINHQLGIRLRNCSSSLEPCQGLTVHGPHPLLASPLLPSLDDKKDA